jgi:hypothetical protein
VSHIFRAFGPRIVFGSGEDPKGGATRGAAMRDVINALRGGPVAPTRTPRQSGLWIRDFGCEANAHYFHHVTFYLLTGSTYAILRLCERRFSN